MLIKQKVSHKFSILVSMTARTSQDESLVLYRHAQVVSDQSAIRYCLNSLINMLQSYKWHNRKSLGPAYHI